VLALITDDRTADVFTHIIEDYGNFPVKVLVVGSGAEQVIGDNAHIQGRAPEWQLLPEDSPAGVLDYVKSHYIDNLTKIKDLFEKFDEDGSETLDMRELLLVLEQLGVDGLSPEEIERARSDIDADGNGEIDFEEFAYWYLSGREKPQN
jgi:hypothetical protein